MCERVSPERVYRNGISLANRALPALIDSSSGAVPVLLRALHSLAPDADAAPADKEQKRGAYCLQPSASCCPECKQPVALIYPEPWQPTLPIFYLCFPCERVGLIGSGQVPWTSAE